MILSQKIVIFCERFVYYIFFALLSFILLANINSDSGLPYTFIFICALIVPVLVAHLSCIKKVIKKTITLLYTSKKIIVLIILAGIILRALPLLCDFTWILADNEGDCAVHYFGAQQLAFNGFLNDNNARYEAIFIQLYSYTFILSVFVN